MDRYIEFLRSDMEQALQQAPPLTDVEWSSSFDESDEESFSGHLAIKLISLPDLLSIPAEAFPPEHLLNDAQIKLLLDDMERLWKAWNLSWDMPQGLTPRQTYNAMHRAMMVVELEWSLEAGGNVEICHYEGKVFCPFGNGGFCNCQNVEEAAKRDLEVWEEHIRAQGFEPSWEDDDSIEGQVEAWRMRNQAKDDWPMLDLHDALGEQNRESSASTVNFSDNDDWMEGFFWEPDTDDNGNQDLN